MTFLNVLKTLCHFSNQITFSFELFDDLLVLLSANDSKSELKVK